MATVGDFRPCSYADSVGREVPARRASSSSRINEQSSGLLIRGFGVQVPGGAPVLTWGFTVPGHFYVPDLSPCLLHVCSRAGTRSLRACQIRGAGRSIS